MLKIKVIFTLFLEDFLTGSSLCVKSDPVLVTVEPLWFLWCFSDLNPEPLKTSQIRF